ncbi:MAG: hypothetical protein BMS9Abin05_2504 [Rhodothermia bacterium]|nr:MAG: hypothetical protein BMS9Abin05_2504 [Rhodothermia bacterium]
MKKVQILFVGTFIFFLATNAEAQTHLEQFDGVIIYSVIELCIV